MSRSDYAQSLMSSAPAAISCVLALMLGAGCRFSTNPGDTVVVDDAGANETSVDSGATPIMMPIMTSTGTKAVPALDAGSEPSDPIDAATSGDAQQDAGAPSAAIADSGSAAPTNAAAGTGAPATADAGSSAPADAAAGTGAPATPVAGSAAPASNAAGIGAVMPVLPPIAAGSLATPMLPVQSPKEAECSADLANCLLREPLGYAECLRANQDNGCPEPDAGVPTTSPVTTEDGKPLTQACQAELANCIARLPTPENAASCTEKARKCK